MFDGSKFLLTTLIESLNLDHSSLFEFEFKLSNFNETPNFRSFTVTSNFQTFTATSSFRTFTVTSNLTVYNFQTLSSSHRTLTVVFRLHKVLSRNLQEMQMAN